MKNVLNAIIDLCRAYDPYDFEEDMIDDIAAQLSRNPAEIVGFIDDEILSYHDEIPADIVNQAESVKESLLHYIAENK